MMVRSTAVSFLFLRVWLVLTLFGLTSLLLVGTSPGADKATFATGFRLNASYVLPPLTAMGKGFWKELGLDVEWVAFDSITDMQRAVAAGSISAGTVGVDNVITGNSQGIAEVIVADINERTEFFFWVPAASPLRRPEDLKKGALLGLSRYGQTTHWYSEIAVKNLGAEKQVKMVAVGGGTPAVAMLKAGRVDLIVFSAFTLMPLLASGEVQALLRVDDYLPEGLGNHQSVYAYRPFLEKSPEAVRRLVAGFFKGTRYVMDNPDWAVTQMKEAVRYSEEAARTALPMIRYSRDGRIDRVALEKKIIANRDILVLQKVVAAEKVPAVGRLYTCDFVGGC